jgi:lipoate-protein ligase B
MKVAEIVVKILEDEGIQAAFGIPRRRDQSGVWVPEKLED